MRFCIFLDVDEFLCLEENRNKDDILNYLKTIPTDKQSELIIKNVENNVLKKKCKINMAVVIIYFVWVWMIFMCRRKL